ncbi:hypothetical protein R8Z50_30260 [Longispora sp. K20-0274]|uniref:hypothetical protein n=1 Tax=Longispora sp. K20-0274 TaxID=3088255 RepID=UPI00399B16D2
MITVAIVGIGRHLDQWLARLQGDSLYRVVAFTGYDDQALSVVPGWLADKAMSYQQVLKLVKPQVLLILDSLTVPDAIRDGLRSGAHVIADLPVAHRPSQVPGYLDLAQRRGRRVVVPARRADPGLGVLRTVLAEDSQTPRPWSVQVDLLYPDTEQPAGTVLDVAAGLLARAAQLAGVQVTSLLADNLSVNPIFDQRPRYEVPVVSTVADGVALMVRTGAVPVGSRGLTGPAGRWTVTAATGTQYVWHHGEISLHTAHGPAGHRPAPVTDDQAPAWLDAVLADLHGTGAGRHLLGAEHDHHARIIDALLRRHRTGKPTGVTASQLLKRGTQSEHGGAR